MADFNYKTFFEDIESSLTLKQHNLDTKIYEIPNIQNQLLRQYMKEKTKLIKLEAEHNRLFGHKYHHYKYESDIRCENKDVAIFYVKKDEEYIEKFIQYEKQKCLCESLEKYLKRVSQMTYDIKNILDYLKYINGAN